MERELSFSKSTLKGDYILYANIFHETCLFFYLPCDCDTSRPKDNCELKRAFMTMRRLYKSMYGAILAYAYIFLLKFLQSSVIFFSNVCLLSSLTLSNFSHSLFFMPYSLTLILTASLELTNK